MDMPADEKISLAREFGYKNDHERDALAAVLGAFKKYKNKFQQVERKIPSEVDPDEVKALVVKGFSIEKAIVVLTSKPTVEIQGSVKQEELEVLPDIADLRSRNQHLTEQVRTLRSYVDELKRELREKEAEMRKAFVNLEMLKDNTTQEIKRKHEIKIRDKEIERLRVLLRSERKYVKKLKRDLACLRDIESVEELKGYMRLKVLETFSKEAIKKTSERWGIGKGDMVMLQDASGGGSNTADLLIEKGIEAVFTDSEMASVVREYFWDKGIPVLSSRDALIRTIKGAAFIKVDDIETARALWREQMKVRQAERKAEWLESIIKEYRVERQKEERQIKKRS
jgi:predicted RNase H-like nuclease (RuvC/YqgF family)